MKTEWWVLLFVLVGLSIGYVLIQTGSPLNFGFLLSYIVPVGLILFGDVVGAFLADILPAILLRFSMRRAGNSPGLYLKFLGWVLLFGGFLLALAHRLAR